MNRMGTGRSRVGDNPARKSGVDANRRLQFPPGNAVAGGGGGREAVDGPGDGSGGVKWVSNKITTSKYNVVSFLPKFLFEQFRRYANIFFLAIGLMQQIPNVSPTGRFVTIVPFMFILFLTALKELLEDVKRNKADDKVNNAKTLVWDRATREFVPKAWKEVVVGDVVKCSNGEFFPADLVLLNSSEAQGMCYIETSNLDGETNLKQKSASNETAGLSYDQLDGQIECEGPNRNLYEFNGRLAVMAQAMKPLGKNTVLLRGARLMNTEWIVGAVIYTGHETKLLMNSAKAPLKRSNIDRMTNYQIIFLFLILICIALLSATGKVITSLGSDKLTYVGETAKKSSAELVASFFSDLLTFVILYNNLIPISLLVTVEFVRFIQVWFIEWDEKMYYKPTDSYAFARTSNLNEELGQIKYVFSDKTGTLTQNIMEYKRASIAGRIFELGDAQRIEDSLPSSGGKAIKDFMTMLSVCHTVIPEKHADGSHKAYNASSPDDRALVEGAETLGYRFTDRLPGDILYVETPSGQEEYQVLNIIEFTSARKRMSVIVLMPDKKTIRLYIKGADSVILSRLGDRQDQVRYKEKTISHLNIFAEDGLRTLCCGCRDISASEYSEFKEKFKQAGLKLEGRDEAIEAVATEVERDLTILGATAIEDKLQDGVPETIEKLTQGNVKVWVLTGDKQETAINIGYSCRLLTDPTGEMNMVINENTLDDTRARIAEYSQRNTIEDRADMSMIIDGTSLEYALKHDLRRDFVELCCACKTVICCRVSPMQKAEVVELVQEHTKAICLSIGDGANDVAMIQKAHVGVGISGNEGMQAVNSSDFAIAQFRFLSRLLFVHGAWFYTRIAKTILYSFYKNITLYIIELWYAMYNNWTGQVLFEQWSIGMYNLIMTSLPPIAIGLFERHCNEETREAKPQLYKATQAGQYFNNTVFWKWMANALIHSVVLYWLPMSAYGYGVEWSSGKSGGYLVLGQMVYTSVMITVCSKAGLEIISWNWICQMAVWGSIALWFLYLILYSYFWPIGLPLAENFAGMIEIVGSAPLFYFCMLLAPIAALMTDVVFITVQTTLFPDETDRARAKEKELKTGKKGQYDYLPEDGNTGCLGGKESLCGPSLKDNRLISNLRSVFVGGSSRSGSPPEDGVEEHEMPPLRDRGYAYSEEEGMPVPKEEYLRRYGAAAAGGGSDAKQVHGAGTPAGT